MKWNLVISPEAEQDIAEAFNWYQQQRQGLGLEYLLRVEASFNSLVHNPNISPPIYKDVHRKLIRRFPFGIFYIIEGSHIIVLAVVHAKRHPRTWKSRRTK